MLLVTGALGNVGAEVVKSLAKAGANIRAGDLNPETVRTRLGEQVQAVELDFGRPETFAPALQGVEGVFLMRPPMISDVKKYLFPFIDAAKAAGVKQIVFLSLIGVEKVSFVPHFKVEQYLRQSGMGWTFLRASFFMQNLNTTHRQEIRERSEINVPVGRARTSFIDVRDIGAVAAKTLTQDGYNQRALDLTGSQALDYYQVAELFTHMLKRPVIYRNPSVARYFVSALRKGARAQYALVTTFLYWSTRNGMAEMVTHTVEDELGRPPITFQQYVEDYQDQWLTPKA
jgi:uncharacterized protein YbjT (DUF2867 family)